MLFYFSEARPTDWKLPNTQPNTVGASPTRRVKASACQMVQHVGLACALLAHARDPRWSFVVLVEELRRWRRKRNAGGPKVPVSALSAFDVGQSLRCCRAPCWSLGLHVCMRVHPIHEYVDNLALASSNALSIADEPPSISMP